MDGKHRFGSVEPELIVATIRPLRPPYPRVYSLFDFKEHGKLALTVADANRFEKLLRADRSLKYAMEVRRVNNQIVEIIFAVGDHA